MKKDEELQLLKTDDGSHTIQLPQMNETYHSTFGALTQSRCVYIENGLLYFLNQTKSPKACIYEIGFGMGLNALSTLKVALGMPCLEIHYHSLEYDPLPLALLLKLNYPDLLNIPKHLSDFVYQAPFGEEVRILPNFHLYKHKYDAFFYPYPTECADVVYFDPFGPDKEDNPLWSEAFYHKMHQLLKAHTGVLCTYCVKGDVRRGLKNVGFQVSKQNGPPGKREILRALKP